MTEELQSTTLSQSNYEPEPETSTVKSTDESTIADSKIESTPVNSTVELTTENATTELSENSTTESPENSTTESPENSITEWPESSTTESITENSTSESPDDLIEALIAENATTALPDNSIKELIAGNATTASPTDEKSTVEPIIENEITQSPEKSITESIEKPTADSTEIPTNHSDENTPTYNNNHRTFAPLNIPLSRRRQTFTILTWLLMPWICLYISFVLLRSHNWYIVCSFIAYLTWMVFFQKYPRQGGMRQQWFRRLECWKWFADFFPIHLHKTSDLPPDRPYIFGCHPHGIISLGAFCNFATEATGFEETFPGINLRLLTLKVNFRIPFYGIYLSMLGVCDASKESCNYILEKGNGNSILLVLGGAKESLDAHPSHEYILTLKNRKGFVKIGLAHGASLVPVFSFGENDLYEQFPNPLGSKLRAIQIKVQKRLGYATPFFKGRGIFQYAFGFLPNRHPIDTYVGEPIPLPKLERDQITPEIVDKYHAQYMEALSRLFDTYKAKHGNADATIKYINDSD